MDRASRWPYSFLDRMIRVLWVEDRKVELDTFLELLNERGIFHAEGAENGAAALRLVRERPYHVVVADLGLDYPGGDQFALIGELAATHPVIVVTGNNTVEYGDAAREKGCIGTLAKPLLVGEPRFVNAVRRAVLMSLLGIPRTPRQHDLIGKTLEVFDSPCWIGVDQWAGALAISDRNIRKKYTVPGNMCARRLLVVCRSVDCALRCMLCEQSCGVGKCSTHLPQWRLCDKLSFSFSAHINECLEHINGCAQAHMLAARARSVVLEES